MTPYEQAATAFCIERPNHLLCEATAFTAGWNAAMRFAEITPDMQLEVEPPSITPADIYAAYPLKVGKQAALKAIKKAQKDTNIGYPKLLEATQAFATAVAQWPEAEKKYVPHPATWFNRGSYDDDPAVWQKGKPVYQSQFSTSH